MNGTATPHRQKNRTTITIKKWDCKKRISIHHSTKPKQVSSTNYNLSRF